jgi:opacity protein-like surface antigen
MKIQKLAVALCVTVLAANAYSLGGVMDPKEDNPWYLQGQLGAGMLASKDATGKISYLDQDTINIYNMTMRKSGSLSGRVALGKFLTPNIAVELGLGILPRFTRKICGLSQQTGNQGGGGTVAAGFTTNTSTSYAQICHNSKASPYELDIMAKLVMPLNNLSIYGGLGLAAVRVHYDSLTTTNPNVWPSGSKNYYRLRAAVGLNLDLSEKFYAGLEGAYINGNGASMLTRNYLPDIYTVTGVLGIKF